MRVFDWCCKEQLDNSLEKVYGGVQFWGEISGLQPASIKLYEKWILPRMILPLYSWQLWRLMS